MRNILSSAALDQIFRTARTYNGWSDTAVDEGVVRDLYDLLKWGPTSANSCPARFVWVRSPEGKAQLAALAAEKNRPKILAAPLTLHDRTYFTEVRPRRSCRQPRGVTMPQSADKIRSDLAAGEEFPVDRVVVEHSASSG